MVGTVPEISLARIERWCRERVPEQVRDRVRVECEVDGRDVTIVDARAPWRPDLGPDWTRLPVARLRYLRSREVWRLYWRDRDEGWHEYRGLPFASSVDELLSEIDRDPTAIFWG
jgi:Protein of unknown function (DUF3024)